MEKSLLGVLVGSAISLVSVYFAEHLRKAREIEIQKIELYKNIKSITHQIYRYSILESQMDVFNNYHQRLYELKKDPYHREEAGRRLRQFEDFKLKYLSLEAEWDKASAVYYLYFGEDLKFQELSKRLEDFDNPEAISFENINDSEYLYAAREAEDKRLTEEIDKALKVYIEDITGHVSSRLKTKARWLCWG